MDTADVIVCGAGMAGVATAHHLAVRLGVERVVLIDERDPLSLTSTKGTEAYRNWWPSPLMVRFMNRSIDLLDELARDANGAFELNRRGYVFLTADPAEGERLRAQSPGEDFSDDAAAILGKYPFVREDVKAMLHVRRAGWMNAKKLGLYLLERAAKRGVSVVRDRAAGIDTTGGTFRAVELASGARIEGRAFVLAAGPLLADWVRPLDLGVPIVNELHGKIAFEDTDGVIPRDAPLMIWNDAVELGARGRFPAGVHFRPRGERTILVIWTYDARVEEPRFPPVFDPDYAEICIHGLSCMIPALARYIDRAKDAIADGGYYCKTPDNRPLIGPLPVEGVYLLGALSGYGVMSSQAAAELVSLHVTGGALPDYAPSFAVDREMDPDASSAAGQL